MARTGFLCFLFLLAACGNHTASSDTGTAAADGHAQFDALFTDKKLPYTLTDTALLDHKDTAQVRLPAFLELVPDSLQTKLFGAKAKVRYTPLARFEAKDVRFYLVKGSSGARHAALLAVAEGDAFKAMIPFLVPDNDRKTAQQSIMEKNGSVSRNTTQRLPDDVVAEGKEVFAYSSESGRFDLVMTDPLNDQGLELINPIDTLGSNHKLAGDYSREKKNLVSVRDGRKPGLLTVFIHIEKNNGECTGEIKGDAQIVSPTMAIYRQPGDPCVLNLKFAKNSVTLEEQEGCGSKRDIECSFDGNFTRKKEQKKRAEQEKVRG